MGLTSSSTGSKLLNDDIEALTAAIEIIKSKEERKEKYFWIGITLGVLITLAFHFLWIIKVGF